MTDSMLGTGYVEDLNQLVESMARAAKRRSAEIEQQNRTRPWLAAELRRIADLLDPDPNEGIDLRPSVRQFEEGCVDAQLIPFDHSDIVAEERLRIEVGKRKGVRVEIAEVTE